LEKYNAKGYGAKEGKNIRHDAIYFGVIYQNSGAYVARHATFLQSI
jgi:hypothetical protein